MSSKIAAPPPHGKAGARAVYVLDDDARVRSSVVYILADGGYQPVEFSEPAPMLEQLKLVAPRSSTTRTNWRKSMLSVPMSSGTDEARSAWQNSTPEPSTHAL
jgi:alkyl hydroperoxide reductase subunit AhpC